jgi:hypothetical protein
MMINNKKNINNNFYDIVNKKYHKYKIHKYNKNYDTYCNNKSFSYQPQQLFLPEYVNDNFPNNNVLIYHNIGSGKTCTAINICEKFIHKKKIIIISPASLIGNFRRELMGPCGKYKYLSKKKNEELLKIDPHDEKYNEILIECDKKIDEYYDIISYNIFVKNINTNKYKINKKNVLLVIDEVHNIISEDGVYYKTIYNFIKKLINPIIILMSATPLFDKPNELGLIMNLFNLKNEVETGKFFDDIYIKTTINKRGKITYDTINIDILQNKLIGNISYFKGAPPFTFPKIIMKYVNCEMSDIQHKAYKNLYTKHKKNIKNNDNSDNENIYMLSNKFYIGSRIISNIIFPNNKVNKCGLGLLTNKIILKNLEKYSIKFHKIMKKIKKTKEKVFIYSNFKSYGGIKSLIKILDAFGFKNYLDYGPGKKRYALWTSDIKMNIRENIKFVYNNINNLYGDIIKIIIGSPSIKEGITLKAVKQVHILEPYWNLSRLEQIIGRSYRFCSHKDLISDQRFVKVYVYIATFKHILTVDKIIKNISIQKKKIIDDFELMLKKVAIDCDLFKKINMIDNKYICK